MLGLGKYIFIRSIKRSLKKIHSHEAEITLECEQQHNIKNAVHHLLKKLSKTQLEVLAIALESHGDNSSSCITMLSSINVPFGKQYISHLNSFICYICRWPNANEMLNSSLSSDSIDNVLIQLPQCKTKSVDGNICCNPYHWSRLLVPGKYS